MSPVEQQQLIWGHPETTWASIVVLDNEKLAAMTWLQPWAPLNLSVGVSITAVDQQQVLWGHPATTWAAPTDVGFYSLDGTFLSVAVAVSPATVKRIFWL